MYLSCLAIAVSADILQLIWSIKLTWLSVQGKPLRTCIWLHLDVALLGLCMQNDFDFLILINSKVFPLWVCPCTPTAMSWNKIFSIAMVAATLILWPKRVTTLLYQYVMHFYEAHANYYYSFLPHPHDAMPNRPASFRICWNVHVFVRSEIDLGHSYTLPSTRSIL